MHGHTYIKFTIICLPKNLVITRKNKFKPCFSEKQGTNLNLKAHIRQYYIFNACFGRRREVTWPSAIKCLYVQKYSLRENKPAKNSLFASITAKTAETRAL